MKKFLKLIFIPVFIIYFIIIKLPYKDIKIETKNFIDVNSGYVKDYKSYKKFL